MSGPDFDRALDEPQEAVEIAEAAQEAEISPDHVIAGMLSFLIGSSFSGDPKDIHETIYEMREKFPKLLGMFAFSKRPIHVFSRGLEITIDHLRLSRIIIMDSDFETYRVGEQTREYLKGVLSRFGEEDRKDLKQMAEMFEERCGQEPLI